MDYNIIANFFDKFKKIIYQKEQVGEIIQKVISENLSFEIDKTSFEIKNGVIFFKCSPVMRTEIVLRKKKILVDLENLLPPNIKIVDIK